MLFFNKQFLIIKGFWTVVLIFIVISSRNYNKEEDNSLKTLHDKNHQALSQKFRQLNNFFF